MQLHGTLGLKRTGMGNGRAMSAGRPMIFCLVEKTRKPLVLSEPVTP
jgi:hypothetical protein